MRKQRNTELQKGKERRQLEQKKGQPKFRNSMRSKQKKQRKIDRILDRGGSARMEKALAAVDEVRLYSSTRLLLRCLL